jgi:3-hydroxyacyl-[acyl-carrier-protein] dehydratase
MRIEYFQLIDRIVDLNLNDLTIRVEANVTTDSTIFEGHFPGRVTPGQALMVSAKIMHEGSGFALTEAEIKVDGKTVCNADITFRVVDFPKGEFLGNMQEVARRIAFPMETVANG